MEDIIRSGILAATLVLSLVFAAPFLNDDKKDSDSEKTELEQKKENNFQIPL